VRTGRKRYAPLQHRAGPPHSKTLASMAAAIILDKSFLQGVGTPRIRELAASHRLLVSDALFYELLTTEEPVRSQCFRKFPPTENPVDLVSHIGPLVRLEISTHKPSGPPSMHRENLRFQFNSDLVTLEYEIPEPGRRAIEEHTEELRSDVASFIQRANLVRVFFFRTSFPEVNRIEIGLVRKPKRPSPHQAHY